MEIKVKCINSSIESLHYVLMFARHKKKDTVGFEHIGKRQKELFSYSVYLTTSKTKTKLADKGLEQLGKQWIHTPRIQL